LNRVEWNGKWVRAFGPDAPRSFEQAFCAPLSDVQVMAALFLY